MKINTLILLYAALIGFFAGVGGVCLSLLLHSLQHIAFGYGGHFLESHESFLMGVTSASPERRTLVLTAGGLLAGIGWWLLYRYGHPLVSIKQKIQSLDKPMPRFGTICHACLQVMTVALGSPLGRETAPREIGAMAADWLSCKRALTPEDKKILIACGAGAGLAAVYNVPFAAVVFTAETLLCTCRQRAIVPALISCGVATLMARLGLGNIVQYHMEQEQVSTPLLLWALICGPIIGLVAESFRLMMLNAKKHAARNYWLPVLTIINFVVIGFVAQHYPQILGNGKGPAQLTFDDQVTATLALILLVLKVASSWTTLRCGASGGLLTPGIASGALLAICLGTIWNHVAIASLPLGGCALIGATAFLSISMQMPMTAIILILELTHASWEFVYPMVIAGGGAVLVQKGWQTWAKHRLALASGNH